MKILAKNIKVGMIVEIDDHKGSGDTVIEVDKNDPNSEYVTGKYATLTDSCLFWHKKDKLISIL